jgi:hypothetical protein
LLALTLAPACLAAKGGLLLSDAELTVLQAFPQRASGLLNVCRKQLDRKPAPMADISPGAHYGANGVQATDAPQTLSPDARMAYRAALCYVLSDDARFASHAQAIIDAWASTLRTVGSRQGQAEVRFNFSYFVIAASWVRGANGWDDGRFRQLLRQTIAPVSNEKIANNQANWSVLLEAAIGGYLAEPAMLGQARERWQALMASQVAADGSLPKEICRTDTSNWCDGPHKGINGMSYTHFTLLPTALAAQVLERQGMSVWRSPGGEQLQRAFYKTAAWTRQPETFPFYADQGGRLNGVRNAAYFALLQRHYPNPDAAQLLEDPKLGMNDFQLLLLFGSWWNVSGSPNAS